MRIVFTDTGKDQSQRKIIFNIFPSICIRSVNIGVERCADIRFNWSLEAGQIPSEAKRSHRMMRFGKTVFFAKTHGRSPFAARR